MANVRATGKCCSGTLCKFPAMELIPEHTCPICKKIVHILCADFDMLTDKYVCKPCSNSWLSSTATEIPIGEPTPTAINSLAILVCGEVKKMAAKPSGKKVRIASSTCCACGGNDHQRKSSSKCPHYKAKPKANVTVPSSKETIELKTREGSISLDPDSLVAEGTKTNTNVTTTYLFNTFLK